MYKYIYQITNKLNKKIYVGVHETNNLEDGYMGSGSYLKNAIKKYGIENFEKIILEFFETSDEMYLKEAEIVNEEFILREDVYNMMTGGEGGKKGVKQSKEMIKKKVEGIRRSGVYEIGGRKGTIWITNGVEEKIIKNDDKIPEDWKLGRSDFHKEKSFEWTRDETKKEILREFARKGREIQQKFWEENPEIFEEVKRKRENTRKKTGNKNKEETGLRYKIKLSKEERSERARNAARAMHEKMKDIEYKEEVMKKREITRKLNQESISSASQSLNSGTPATVAAAVF